MKTLRLTFTNTFKQHYALLYLALFCTALLLVRAKLTHSMFYSFLIWNLFLAYLPLLVSLLMINNVKLMEKRIYYYPLLLCWLLLLPNAPYIITDFIHLKKVSTVPIWYDVLLLISFSTGGILAGLASMKHIFSIITIKTNPLVAWFSIAITCFLSGFGIYLGRFLRYNSWDVLSKPLTLTNDVLQSFTSTTPLGITLGFGCFLLLLFHLYYTADK
ncbi:DUF1361 domain-containing protein [Flavobacterium arcticum]|uniref:DUF1361 domain-containing protein n=1 Tax=Flavobacterium arcticum TaxID=1784713 RepID=A0A345HE62_9FLAO|nr:DUF1361 domain-containing protein [Flavobacterium arcticum]AXG74872.1 DUF1361 domain-containing protein [Flavobacterium arcticum]KAF2509630.1 DUF1361 domain-containing protein [Flavobacterium arcticum]